MAWIEAHQELPRHPKTKRFARMLKISIPQAVGHLFMFWWWALDYAENGDLSRYDADDLADAANWDGDPQEFLTAMIECGPGGSYGFIEKNDDGMFVHDWEIYSGRLVEKREKNRQRQAKGRKNNKSEKINSESELKISAHDEVENVKVKHEKKSDSNSDSKNEKISVKKSKNIQTKVKSRENNLSDDDSNEHVTHDNNVTSESVTRESHVSNAPVTRESHSYTTQQNRTQQNRTETDPSPTPPKKSAAASAAVSEINLGEIVRLWNKILAPLGFSHVLKATPAREQALKILLDTAAERKNFLWWQQVFDRVSSSEFLQKSIRERKWFTLDWLLNENNLVKILEGRYDNNKPAKNQNSVKSIAEILEQHEKSKVIDAEYIIAGEGETYDGERSPGFL